MRLSPEQLAHSVISCDSVRRDSLATGADIAWIQDPSNSLTGSHTIQGNRGDEYNIQVANTALDDNHQYVHETVQLSRTGFEWEASSVRSTRVPLSSWVAFITQFLLQIVILIEIWIVIVNVIES